MIVKQFANLILNFKAKKAMTGEVGEKPACVKTHVRNVVIIPEMVGSVVGIYNGKGLLKILNWAKFMKSGVVRFSPKYKKSND